eukprot:TRINITY_DN9542_c0_g1_i2.p3 TRINITY_DN9542_c0_g1~~TRINITY_DN9542_c0_g1_i2.p3  ORF type:complete len:111 (-),score=32.28 TRINITY_DN9542_c0_g1_i2:539-871(-)
MDQDDEANGREREEELLANDDDDKEEKNYQRQLPWKEEQKEEAKTPRKEETTPTWHGKEYNLETGCVPNAMTSSSDGGQSADADAQKVNYCQRSKQKNGRQRRSTRRTKK